KSNKYFCGVEEDYILDRSNLTSLKDEPSNNAQTLDPVAGVIDDDIQDELTGALDVQACRLCSLVYSRWIVTARGLA
ncbi:hypothetical protein PAXINDRAFT_43765, partial [Paxillus involutus ATCC 200175]